LENFLIFAKILPKWEFPKFSNPKKKNENRNKKLLTISNQEYF